MKKLFFILLTLMSSISLFSANVVVYSENFENATVGATTLGNADAMNYGGGAVWTFGLETNYPITGLKSGYFNVTNTGSDWWTLQYRIDSKFLVKQGVQYKVTFNIQSSVANTIGFNVQDAVDFKQTLNLKGAYTIEKFSITTTPMDRDDAKANFMWAFGKPGVPAEIWIDDIVIEELASTAVDENSIDKVKVWSTGNKLIIDSSELCSANVYSITGQKILSTPLNVSGRTSVNISNNKIVLVKLTSTNGVSKMIKVQMN